MVSELWMQHRNTKDLSLGWRFACPSVAQSEPWLRLSQTSRKRAHPSRYSLRGSAEKNVGISPNPGEQSWSHHPRRSLEARSAARGASKYWVKGLNTDFSPVLLCRWSCRMQRYRYPSLPNKYEQPFLNTGTLPVWVKTLWARYDCKLWSFQ